MSQLAALLAFAVTIGLAYVAVTSWHVRRRALDRLYEQQIDERTAALDARSIPEQRLARWLLLAGYRRPNAAAMFIAATAASAAAGLIAGAIYRVRFERLLVQMVASVPGSIGELLATILQSGPWILLIGAAMVPALLVRSARRRRVRAIEQDLPLALELLATIGEAGLGFDAALAKIVRAQGPERPLASEFVNFQLDMLAGMPRLQALRQLARRIEITPITSFTSALIQAEQVGASMAETIRHQADDLRQRRREDALLQAQALPVKLVFPLVICFLPGIFISTLAPVIFQMIEVAGGVLRAGR
jgi:tight adherence protein C